MRRRDFLKMAAVSTTGAVVFTGCSVGSIGNGNPEREFRIESPVMNPADVIYGRDAWYSSVCQECSANCGIVIRAFEGRAKKVEGNPDFPVNLGATCPRAQAIVQGVYHPDRVPSPRKLSGTRGSGTYQASSWDQALSELKTRIADAQSAGPGSIVMITEPLSGQSGLIVNRFASGIGARQVSLEPDERIVLRETMRRLFGVDRLPTLDLPNSRFLVSFGADFLHNWISPVQFSMGYGQFRQGRPDVRGLYYYVGPQLSGTAANADRWLPIKPGTEGLVALSMVQVMTSEGLVDSGIAGQVYGGVPLDQYNPNQIASRAGLSADQIRDLARRFATERPSVAIAGTSAAAQTNGLFNLTSIFGLNYLVGGVGTTGGLVLNPPSPFPADVPVFTSGLSYRDWATLVNDMKSGKIRLVMVHRANPVYALPAASGFREALASVPSIVSFSSFVDETSALADLLLPDTTTTESWGIQVPDPGPGFQTVGLQQPVVLPFVDSRSFPDVLLNVASQIGGSVKQGLPWTTYEEAVRAAAEELRGLNRGNVSGGNPKEYFVNMQTQGGWWDTGNRQSAPGTPPQQVPPPSEPQFAGNLDDYPYYLLPFPANAIGYGESTYLPWMQGLPDPISTNTWNTWVELNPTTAGRLGVTTGDVVRVTTPIGSQNIPVYVNPAMAPDIAAVPFGRGHTAFGRYAEGHGVNPLEIIAPQMESETGALAWAATRARIEKTTQKVRLARLEGQVPAFQLEEAPIIEVTHRGTT
ncbi:molybdopterin-containing oxidoreductase family protein [Nitrolancea hollandica]|uniref:Molybdopterin oxidoreductase, large subunit n=1 Tax=Nitrolancea hollandica Lb TaxID=1129897 RepID=I4EFP2_9BACT|nr:molybdopterin-dependent oxidoreductase [Nitrolancea hollandica]CCF83504.1 Molybdopterin oxidoreductase, large subunit [Nitrolancea hollandica Lb]